MADFADRASALSEQYLAQALAAESATECEDCGEPIPETRRRAVPGCTRCIECQTDHDRITR